MPVDQVEGLAAELLEETQILRPVSAFALAWACGFELTAVGAHEEGYSGREARYHGKASYRDQHELLARAVATWKLERSGYFASDAAVSKLARALLLPRAEFAADVASAKGMPWLMSRYPYASAAMIGARMGDVGALQQTREHAATM